MTNRIWEELSVTVFNNYYLVDFIDRKKKILIRTEVLALIFSIAGIMGWYRYPKEYYIWSVLLILIQLGIFYRGIFLTKEGEIIVLELVANFYQEQKIELERLWQDFSSEKISEDQAEKKYRAIQVKEADMMKKYNYKNVKNIVKLNLRAVNRRDEYLKRFF